MTEQHIVFDKGLTKADRVVLKSLHRDLRTNIEHWSRKAKDRLCDRDSGIESDGSACSYDEAITSNKLHDVNDIAAVKAARDPQSDSFEPTVVMSVDDCSLYIHPILNKYLLQPYIRTSKRIVRHDTDTVMVTHLILYFMTLVPSALLLFRHFTYLHATIHITMQLYYVGTYTLMKHQHIHQHGILAKQYGCFDQLFPYVLDPLMGHTWNSYYYHHVKHHHVEGNGPDDLSSTLRYQRDSVADFLRYVGRFFFLIWIDLPLYFLRKNRPGMALKAAGWEFTMHAYYYFISVVVGFKATMVVYIFPLLILRLGLMIGNFGQHAFVDHDEPDSDFRSSITVIDVASNRFCFNDGYHTSHHLNPLRHWRDHPISFLEQKYTYAKESALVFHNIDFLMITFRLLCKDYEHLAKCLVPMGDQINLTMEDRIQLLKGLTRRFTEEEIAQKFRKTQ